MPKRTDISSILIIGAGPIVIGQSCEFDYSGVQACKALRAEGYRIVLVNSNTATIMTDPDVGDAPYIEPLTPEVAEKIIAKARPDVIDKAEDRQKFRDAMDKIGLESPKSQVAHTIDEALAGLELVGLPAI